MMTRIKQMEPPLALEKQQDHHCCPDEETTVSKSEPKMPEIGSFNTRFHHFRYVIILLSGIMMGMVLLLRVSMAIAMISMVNKTEIYLIEHPNSTADEFFAPDYVELGEFVWNNEIQQIIMTGYMVAYAIPQVFTTKLALKYGIRSSVAIALAMCSISSILTPVMSYWGWEWVLLLRFVNALGASPILPSVINVIEQWMPYEDAAQGIAIYQLTANVMYTFTPLISGYLTSASWKLTFYVPGAIGLVFCCVWFMLSSDSPDSSKFISQKEYNMINGLSSDSSKQTKQVKEKPDLPWYFMFQIKEFYFMTFVWTLHCSTSGGFIFLMPAYMNRVLSVPVEEIGLLNFTVQIGQMFCMLWPGPFVALIQDKFGFSLTTSRRITFLITCGSTAATYFYLGVFHDHLIIAIAINRFFHMTNDTIIIATLMSQYGKTGLSGLIYSTVNAFGNLFVVCVCWAAGRALDHTGETLECWSWILIGLSILMIVYFSVYTFTCKSEPIEIDGLARKKSIECGKSDSKPPSTSTTNKVNGN